MGIRRREREGVVRCITSHVHSYTCAETTRSFIHISPLYDPIYDVDIDYVNRFHTTV